MGLPCLYQEVTNGGKIESQKMKKYHQQKCQQGQSCIGLGGTLHGAGANVSNDWRYGVILTYSLGWLRQEENQYLDVPSEEVKKLSKDLARLIGYRAYGGLGFSINPEHFFLQEDSSYRD